MLSAAFELRGTGPAEAWLPQPSTGELQGHDSGAAQQPPTEPAPVPADLPWSARVYVGGVTLFGAALVGALFPQTLPDPVLSLGLLTLVVLGSTLKVQLPVPGTSATLSVSFIANFMALILVGPGQAMVLAGLGGAVQCLAARRTRPLPIYRVLFSMSALVITVQVTHLVYAALGGQTGALSPRDLATPVVGGACAYFLCNALLVALATSLATGQSAWRTWVDAYLWSGVSFVAGAGVAVAAVWFIDNHEVLSAIALAAPVYLTYRTYHVYLGNIERERQHAAEVSALNIKAMQALDQAHRSEQALALEKERLGVTLGSIGDAVLAADTQSRVVLLNHAAEEYTGWDQAHAVGTPITEVFHLVDRENGQVLANPVPQVLRTKARVDRDTRAALIARDGTRRLVEYSATPVCDPDGTVVAVVLVARDVTESVQVDAERNRASKLAALGVLAGGIAHDFNNILTAIVGNISLAQLDDATDAQRASLFDAEKACMRAKGLTHQLLTFSKGGAPLKRHILLPSLIRDASTFALRGSNVKCAFDVANDLWLVNADEQQFVQVINNLVINAMQAMPDGGVVLVRAENVTARGEAQAPHVRISVIDHGVGIPPEHLGKIFDPYFTTKAVCQGLGLATSYSIVANHGGSIAVETTQGRGTTMTILLPAVNDLCTLAPVEAPPVMASGRRGRILVMDDEEQVRDVTRMMLRRLGYRVDVAADGAEAIEQYREALGTGDRFDAVLMDLTIPGGMGGKAAIRELLALDPAVTAIVSSGYADAPVMADFEDYGFKGVVPKPFTFTELRRLLQQVMPAA
jgi:PAS domain S-box-containing protein